MTGHMASRRGPDHGNVVSANVTFIVITTTLVSDGVSSALCGTVTWNATVNWPLNGKPTGQATVTGGP